MANSKTKALKKDIMSGNQVNAKGKPGALPEACGTCGSKSHKTKDCPK
jgi:hypothetical protein